MTTNQCKAFKSGMLTAYTGHDLAYAYAIHDWKLKRYVRRGWKTYRDTVK